MKKAEHGTRHLFFFGAVAAATARNLATRSSGSLSCSAPTRRASKRGADGARASRRLLRGPGDAAPTLRRRRLERRRSPGDAGTAPVPTPRPTTAMRDSGTDGASCTGARRRRSVSVASAFRGVSWRRRRRRVARRRLVPTGERKLITDGASCPSAPRAAAVPRANAAANSTPTSLPVPGRQHAAGPGANATTDADAARLRHRACPLGNASSDCGVEHWWLFGWQGARHEVLSSTSVGSHGEGSVLTSGTSLRAITEMRGCSDGCYEVRVRSGGARVPAPRTRGWPRFSRATPLPTSYAANHPVSRDGRHKHRRRVERHEPERDRRRL